MNQKRKTGAAPRQAATGKKREQGKYNDNNLARQGFSKAQIETARRRLPSLDEVAGDSLVVKTADEHAGPCPHYGERHGAGYGTGQLPAVFPAEVVA